MFVFDLSLLLVLVLLGGEMEAFLRDNAFLSGLWSRSLTFLLLVVAWHTSLPHLLVLQMRILLGFFRTFPHGKKVRSAGQVVSARLGEHVSSSTLRRSSNGSCRRARGLRRFRRLGAGPSPPTSASLSLEQTYQLDHQSRAGGCRGCLGCGEAGTRDCVVLEPGHWSHCT